MAIENIIICNTADSCQSILAFLRRLTTGVVTATDEAFHFKIDGLYGSVMPASALLKELITTTYSFVPAWRFNLRLDKFEGFAEGLENTIAMSVAVITELAKDCVIMIPDGNPVVLKVRGRTTIKGPPSDSNEQAILAKIVDCIGQPDAVEWIPKI